jgi:hypothetical protein
VHFRNGCRDKRIWSEESLYFLRAATLYTTGEDALRIKAEGMAQL